MARQGRLTCWECRLIEFNRAEGGYSEQTPGSDASLSCRKDHWSMDAWDDTEATLRAKIFTAETCADFEPFKP